MKKITMMFFALLFVGVSTNVFATSDKKDIKDPVLKEMISSLDAKMPRFIDKHGQNVFVADEQVTRGALLQALYEYDKKNTGKSSSVSKQEIDTLKTRISALEKGEGSTSSVKKGTSANIDVIQMMNELEPNMPTLLDNSLNNSKVFKQLQKKVDEVKSPTVVAAVPNANVSANAGGITSAQMSSLKSEVSNLNKKYDTLVLSANKNSKINTSVENLQKEVNSLTIKVQGLENSKNKDLTASQISNIKSDLTELNKKYENLSAALSSTKDNKMSSAQVAASISNMKKEMSDMNTKINTLSSDKSSDLTASQISNIKSNLTELNKKYENLSAALSSTKDNKMSSAQVAASISNMRKEMNDINSKIETLNSNKGDISSSQVESLKKEISSVNTKIADLQKNVDESRNMASTSLSKKEKEKIDENFSKMSKKLSESHKYYSNLEKRVSFLEQRPVLIKSDAADNSDIAYLEARVDSIKSEIENVPSNEKIKEQINKTNKKTLSYIEKLESRIDELENRLRELEKGK